MISIDPKEVQKLRAQTGAGLLDCKKALQEAKGDFEKATRVLREKGMASAEKRSDRAANEGRIFLATSKKCAVILEISCETDFVALNESMSQLGDRLVSELADLNSEKLTQKQEEYLKEVASTLKENLSLKRVVKLDINPCDVIGSYLHSNNKVGCIVRLHASSQEAASDSRLKDFAKDLAMHISALKPSYLDRNSVDSSFLKELEEIQRKKTEGMDKPEKVLEGIIKGRMNKELAEICLMEQSFVKDDSLTVENKKKLISKEVGSDFSILEFVRLEVGKE